MLFDKTVPLDLNNLHYIGPKYGYWVRIGDPLGDSELPSELPLDIIFIDRSIRGLGSRFELVFPEICPGIK